MQTYYPLLIIYFVSLGICSLSTIYKTSCFKNMLCKQILGNIFWSLIPVVNTFKAGLWIVSMIVEAVQKRKMPDGSN
ncbi:MAG: hypothetical protein ACAH06_10265 [Methylophilaceae bacterium]|jgi:hypothetical protein|uniref:hypothetical protein n=1 Tax=Methylobacillus sp. MM3 TaxID=1848039 RepID=UPI0007E00D5E|nr:hypothetical protein [Methylobacillus sp. MM3]OAJ71479.1 hypothetical protein A7976_08150 [Methylobacillus sp. MM3]